METKDAIRKRITELRNSFDDVKIREDSRRIRETLFEMSEYRNADIIFIYMSYGSEVRTAEIIEDAFASGKTVAIPKVQSSSKMEFFAVKDLENLKPGFHGILEPEGNDDMHIFPDLMLIPGIAFDEKCNRVGHGKGYYDRYLATIPDTAMIALSYDEQIVPEIPAALSDHRMDKIITPTRIIERYERR